MKKRVGIQKAWSEEELLKIRIDYLEGISQSDLAKEYNTTQKTISKIVTLKCHNDIGVPDNYYGRMTQMKREKGRR